MQLAHIISIFFALSVTFNGFASEIGQSDAENNFKQGQAFYKDGKFDAAVDEFSKAISQLPDESRYHHWLAKSYGELAETSGWLKAVRLAKNSKESLKRAVELDPENISALKDLMRYYQQAPRFLGGNSKKAKGISIRLKELKERNTHSFNNHHVTTLEHNS
jgi:tetratricopeptide (TPR) repeat protein